MTPGPAAPGESEAVAHFQQLGTGKIKLQVEVHGLAAGNYEIVIGGVVRGTLAMLPVGNNEVEGTIVFESAPVEGAEILINYPVAGLQLIVRQNVTIYFTTALPGVL